MSGGDLLAPVALPPAKDRLVPIKSKTGCEHSREEKNLLPLTEIQSLFFDFPVRKRSSVPTELSALVKIQLFR